MAFSSLSTLSLQPSAFPELYEPLWWWSGSSGVSSASTSSTAIVRKGTTQIGNWGNQTSSMTLITISNSFPPSQKFAFEATIWPYASGATVYAELFDLTTNTEVTASRISATSTDPTVRRSGQFTLTNGHKYGIALWQTGTTSAQLLDASLIIFPTAGSASPSLSRVSLTGSGSGLTEAYIPLWVYSNGMAQNTTSNTTSGTAFLQKGATSTTSMYNASPAKLHTLSAGWSPTQQFVFEASFTNNASGGTTSNLALWDITSNALVGSSQISMVANGGMPSLVRSSKFTLAPGHVYGVTLWQSSSSQVTEVNKAHLVALSS